MNSSNQWRLLALAWLISLISSLGILFIGEVMGKTPCSLCWFQRVFMFPLAIILGVALVDDDTRAWRYALPLSLSGAAVAGFHSLLYVGFIDEQITTCADTGVSCVGGNMVILERLPLPVLSLAAFFMISALLLLSRRPFRTS